MSYMTFEINNGKLTLRPAIYKGIASSRCNNLKSFDNPMLEDDEPEYIEPEYGSDLIDFED